jgi:photosystem II stability/assembly factor-like uncharacterized protein
MKTVLLVSLFVFCAPELFPLFASEVDFTSPVMVDVLNGWKMKYTDKAIVVLRTRNGGKNWTDVSPAALAIVAKRNDSESYEDITALCPLDKQRAWLAVTLKDRVMLEYTSSGDRDWGEIAGPKASASVYISFLNEREGFVMTSRGSLGNHYEWVYHTADAGLHWETLGSPTEKGSSYYADGITFRNSREGWIGASYHGVPDAPLFHTADGGRTWHVQSFEIPADYRGGYANTSAPVFTGPDKKKGYLLVTLVRHAPPPDHEADVRYETNDGGATWHLPASGVQSTLLQ